MTARVSCVISFEVLDKCDQTAPNYRYSRCATTISAWAPCSGNYAFWYFFCTCKRWHHLHFTTRMHPMGPPRRTMPRTFRQLSQQHLWKWNDSSLGGFSPIFLGDFSVGTPLLDRLFSPGSFTTHMYLNPPRGLTFLAPRNPPKTDLRGWNLTPLEGLGT